MKRPWFTLGLLMFLCSFSVYTGMNLVFIPFFVLLFLLLPDKRLFLLFPLMILRLQFLPHVEAGEVQGEFLIRPLSPLTKDACVLYEEKSYYLSFYEDEAGLFYGKLLLEPFSQKRSPSGFCPRDYYHAKGYHGQVKILKKKLLEKRTDRPYETRARLFQRAQIFGSFQGIAYSLLFGLKEGMEDHEKELFSQLGMMHLFVVSGLHLGIYRQATHRFIAVLKGPRLLGDVLSIVLMLALCLISGFHVSTLRSLGIYLLRTVGFYRREKVDTLESIGLVSFLLLLYRPSYASSFSFLLGSFAYGILRISKKRRLLWMYLLMLPLQLFFIPQIRFTAYLLNSLMAMLMVTILPLLLLAFIFPVFSPLLVYLLEGMMILMRGVESITISWQIVPLGWVCCLFFYGILLVCQYFREDQDLYLWVQSRRVKVVFLLCLLLFYRLENDFRIKGIHFFDVGQGDSSLIVTDNKTRILIDTGRGEQVHRLLHSLGISEIDVLILSHFDEDHSGEVDRLRYKKLYYPLGSEYASGYPLAKGDVLKIDEVVLRVMSPDQPVGERNEDSIVFYLEKDDLRCLYTGDVGKKLLKKVQAQKVDVYKYPHHGSRHSFDEEYLDDLSPGLIVLSYGKNRYGHPHQEILDYATTRSRLLFKTMEEGNLQIKKKGYRSY